MPDSYLEIGWEVRRDTCLKEIVWMSGDLHVVLSEGTSEGLSKCLYCMPEWISRCLYGDNLDG